MLAVLFALLTAAAYGSGTGPGTTGNAGADALTVDPATVDAVRRMQAAPPAPVPQVPVQVPAPPTSVPEAPAADLAPAASHGQALPKQRAAKQTPAKKRKRRGKGKGNGKGLGNTYCQELKRTGGPAFGRCIAAKAHERNAGKRKKR